MKDPDVTLADENRKLRAALEQAKLRLAICEGIIRNSFVAAQQVADALRPVKFYGRIHRVRDPDSAAARADRVWRGLK